MAISNRDRIGKALDLLVQGLYPFVEREMKVVHKDKWLDIAKQSLADLRFQQHTKGNIEWDSQAILTVMWDNWNTVFNKVLGPAERSLVGEIKQARNRWAHQQSFSVDDTYRAIDSIGRLLSSVAAGEQATEMERQKNEILRLKFEEDRKKEQAKTSAIPLGGLPSTGLKPWREVITPHPDVASGRYQQAEFAADLNRVYIGESSDEYGDPQEFFSRTYITAGLKDLLSSAILRLNGKGGDPIIELQTSFGGGKTHSLLALYHTFSGLDASKLAGLEPIVHELGEIQPIKAKRAVLVGSALNAAKPRVKKDGTKNNTLWGELAWQLCGKEGYQLVRTNDEQAVSPGADLLRELFKKAGPSLILMDELVVFLRLLYHKSDLIAGSFDANLSFFQALNDAAQGTKNTLVVASLPASDKLDTQTIEVGGEAGRESLERLQRIFDRVAKPWRPANTEESFEIVRRRLFLGIEAQNYAARDAVCKAFVTAYKKEKTEFPSVCSEAEYERRMLSAYPIHPELFDRLFGDWSTLDKFQRTRGVLRLIASVISSLWQRNDANLLIMPAFIPIDDTSVKAQLMRYLDDSWAAVMDKEVDGEYSLPKELDKTQPSYGRVSACRRIGRTLFMGSAASENKSNKGLDISTIKLGCYQPGETVAIFGDALRKLADSANYIYSEGARYWYSLQPSVNRLAEDRAGQYEQFTVYEEITRRLKSIRQANKQDNFVSVHIDAQPMDVPDEYGVRLVVLGPDYPNANKDDQSSAKQKASEILKTKGSSPRYYMNTLIFAAPDRPRLQELESAVRKYLAWKAIDDESADLNLVPSQAKQAAAKTEEFNRTVDLRIQETYIWLLIPEQANSSAGNGQTAIQLEETKIEVGNEPLPVRAWRKLRAADAVIEQYAGPVLRQQLDRTPLWRGNHITVKQLVEDYAKYLYLPRVRDPEVILRAIEDGVANTAWTTETFAYSDLYDEQADRYNALKAGARINVSLSNTACIVKPDFALKQISADREKEKTTASPFAAGATAPIEGTLTGSVVSPHPAAGITTSTAGQETSTQPVRFYGRANIDSTRPAREFGKVVDEVINHLTALHGADVEITLEMSAKVKDGFPPHVVRTVLENCRTLKFSSSDFENE